MNYMMVHGDILLWLAGLPILDRALGGPRDTIHDDTRTHASLTDTPTSDRPVRETTWHNTSPQNGKSINANWSAPEHNLWKQLYNDDFTSEALVPARWQISETDWFCIFPKSITVASTRARRMEIVIKGGFHKWCSGANRRRQIRGNHGCCNCFES